MRVPKHDYTFQIVQTDAELAALATTLGNSKAFYFDTETFGLKWWQGVVACGLGFATYEGAKLHAWYVPIRHEAVGGQGNLLLAKETYENVDPAKALAALKPVLEDPSIAVIGANLKYDYHIMRNDGVTLTKMRDLMPAARLARPDYERVALDELMRLELGAKHKEWEAVKAWARDVGLKITDKKQSEGAYAKVPIGLLGAYCCADVRWTAVLYKVYMGELLKKRMHRIIQTEMELVEVCSVMEENGLAVDIDYLRAEAKRTEDRLKAFDTEVHKLAGRVFDIGSNDQLADVLFTKLKLKTTRKTGKVHKRSVAKDALKDIVGDGKGPKRIVKALLERAKLSTMLSTFLGPLCEKAWKGPDGVWRVYPNFNSSKGRFGRFSSSNPNAQNLPRDDTRVRRGFVPEPEGYKVLRIDYRQIEYALLAHFSREPGLLLAFWRGIDVHQVTADLVGKSRDIGKTANFSNIYGAGSKRFAATAGILETEAKRIQADQRRTQPYVEGLKRSLQKTARQKGGIRNPFGRRVAIDPEHSYIATNGEIQSTAADIAKLAMVRVHKLLKGRKSKLIAMIHDELVVQWHVSEVGVPMEIVRLMTDIPGDDPTLPSFRVPMSVDVKVTSYFGGDTGNWADAVEVKAPGFIQMATKMTEEHLAGKHKEWATPEWQKVVTKWSRTSLPASYEGWLETGLRLADNGKTGVGQATLGKDLATWTTHIEAMIGGYREAVSQMQG